MRTRLVVLAVLIVALTPTETVKVILGWGARSLSVEFNLAELR